MDWNGFTVEWNRDIETDICGWNGVGTERRPRFVGGMEWGQIMKYVNGTE